MMVTVKPEDKWLFTVPVEKVVTLFWNSDHSYPWYGGGGNWPQILEMFHQRHPTTVDVWTIASTHLIL